MGFPHHNRNNFNRKRKETFVKGAKMIFCITIGDWSEDGHNHYRQYYYRTNATLKRLRKAYNKGCEKVGFDLFDECSEYECNVLMEKASAYLGKEDEDGWVSSSEFSDGVVKLIKEGDKKIEIEEVKAKMFNGWWCDDERFNSQLGYGVL